ncbi:MAG: energy transducer TonB [Methylophilaceae bacterium]|nr:energy transducer TonB [Methylophilaceae bacterium]
MSRFNFRTAIAFSVFIHLLIIVWAIKLKVAVQIPTHIPLTIEVQLLKKPAPSEPISQLSVMPQATTITKVPQPQVSLKRHSIPQHELMQSPAIEPISQYTPLKLPPINQQIFNNTEVTTTAVIHEPPALQNVPTTTATPPKTVIINPSEPIPNSEVTNSVPLKTGVSISASYAKSNRKPEYPSVSRRFNEQGTVVLKVLVKEDGTAGLVEIKNSSGFPLLDESAKNAVSEWHFNPAKIDGKSINEIYVLSIPFILKN